MGLLRLQMGFLLAVTLLVSAIAPAAAEARTVRPYQSKTVSSEHKIKEVFDRFHYTMAVEWDQKDEEFKRRAEEDLAKALIALKASGVSMTEIQKYLEKVLLAGKSQAEFQRFLRALDEQNPTPEEATEMTTKFLEKNYNEGAHFNGGGWRHGKWKVVAAVIIVVVVTHLILRDNDDSDHDHHDDDYKDPCDYSAYKRGGCYGHDYGHGYSY